MNELEKNVLDDYDELMDFDHDKIEDLKYDLEKLKIRDRVGQLQKENTDYKEMNKILADSRLKILGENQELKKRHEELIFMLAEKDKQIDGMAKHIDELEHDIATEIL